VTEQQQRRKGGGCRLTGVLISGRGGGARGGKVSERLMSFLGGTENDPYKEAAQKKLLRK